MKRGWILVALCLLVVAVSGTVYASPNEDVNENGIINVVDLGMVAMKLGTIGCDAGNNWCNRTDVDRKGYVNVVDLGKVASLFGSVFGSCSDIDRDGYNATGTGCGIVDCNDQNANIHPNAVETCNGYDNNCNGLGDSVCTIEFLTIGDPYNAPDLNLDTMGYLVERSNGQVNYTYKLAKYELTREQFMEMLNDAYPEGIGGPGSYKDILINATQPRGYKFYLFNNSRFASERNNPVMIDFYSSARFINWLEKNKSGQGTTEGNATFGVYDTRTFDDGWSWNDTGMHRPGSKYSIPTHSEWYKASYYKGNNTGNRTAGYWAYTAQMNTPPLSGFPGPDTYGNAVWELTPAPPAPQYVVPIGSYLKGKGPYGHYDQGGNVNEWTEGLLSDISSAPNGRMNRGGQFIWVTDHWWRYYVNTEHHVPPSASSPIGLRVAASYNESGGDIVGLSPDNPTESIFSRMIDSIRSFFGF